MLVMPRVAVRRPVMLVMMWFDPRPACDQHLGLEAYHEDV